jgi:hypothetical protein
MEAKFPGSQCSKRVAPMFEDGTKIPISGQLSRFRNGGFWCNLLTCLRLRDEPTGLLRAIL